jgi:hypothetical protein
MSASISGSQGLLHPGETKEDLERDQDLLAVSAELDNLFAKGTNRTKKSSPDLLNQYISGGSFVTDNRKVDIHYGDRINVSQPDPLRMGELNVRVHRKFQSTDNNKFRTPLEATT